MKAGFSLCTVERSTSSSSPSLRSSWSFWKIDSTLLLQPLATKCNDLQTRKVLQREISARRRTPVAIVGDDSTDYARSRVQPTLVEGCHGP